MTQAEIKYKADELINFYYTHSDLQHYECAFFFL